jgi:putative sporulation protein YtaF
MFLNQIITSALLISTLSTDAFAAAFAYGSDNIRIPFVSRQIINVICSLVFALSLIFGAAVRPYADDSAAKTICFVILFVLGVIRFLDSSIKSFIKAHSDLNREIRFSLFSVRIILRLYADPQQADFDRSRTLSAIEASSLAAALSLDGIAAGFSLALTGASVVTAILMSLIMGWLGISLGWRAGFKASSSLPVDLSWISGIVLISLAVIKLFEI